MALRIYGTKKKVKIDKSLGEQICPNCGHKVEMALAHESGYYHLYWIPIIPIGGWKIKLCPACGISEKLSKEDFKSLKNS